MKKLFKEPELEILTFLCNEGTAGSPDTGDVGGDNGADGGDIDTILP